MRAGSGVLPRPALRPSAGQNRRVIFTAVTGDHDTLKPPAVVERDIDYVAYTDTPGTKFPEPWRTVRIWHTGRNPRVTARWHKILPHVHLHQYDCSFWIDANYEVVGPFSALFDELAETSLATHRHPERDCVYAEADAVKANLLDHPAIVDLQMEYYRRVGLPARSGLVETGIMFRSHRDVRVKLMMHEWWGQIESFSQRDQLSANYIFWKHDFKYTELAWPSRSSGYLRYHAHARPATHFETEGTTSVIDWLRRAAISGAAYSATLRNASSASGSEAVSPGDSMP
jgi:hypothetical protein